ncbi:MAG: 4Fe-4S binding protein [Actinomycetota bacterium]
MAIDERNLDEARKLDDARKLDRARKPGFGIGLLKGMVVTLKHMFKHNTVIQYPDEKQDLPSRTRGVIALKEENCTVCMLCARECPDWCIYIDSHKEQIPAKRQGGRPRKRNVLDRFAIDYALCMYCGICVEVCPYDALFWSREFEYAEYDIRELTHEKEKLSDWMASVLPPPELEAGAELPGRLAAGATTPDAPSRAATPARKPTQTSSAVETRPEQAADAPKAPTAAPTASTQESVEEKAPQQTSDTQVEEKIAPDKAESEPEQPSVDGREMGKSEAAITAAPPSAEETSATDEKPSDAPDARATAPPEPTPARPKEPPPSESELEAVYKEVLEEQLAKGSSPQVAEARAKVARVKAERRVGRTPTLVHTDKAVPSAPTRGEPAPPTPPGAPEAEEPQPEQGPVAATEPEGNNPEQEAKAPPEPAESAPEPEAQAAEEDPEAVYERVLAEERAKGSSDAVATGRAKAARVRAQKGTKGPQG